MRMITPAGAARIPRPRVQDCKTIGTALRFVVRLSSAARVCETVHWRVIWDE